MARTLPIPATAARPDPSGAEGLARRLTPGTPQTALTPLIAACRCTEPVRAGLYLLNGDWDSAHRAAQDIDTPLGAHWHALMHRHEPDFPNSKYWLAQAGASPIYPALAEAARAAGHAEAVRNGRWDAARFTDCFADPTQAAWTRALDALEQRALLEHCLALERGS